MIGTRVLSVDRYMPDQLKQCQIGDTNYVRYLYGSSVNFIAIFHLFNKMIVSPLFFRFFSCVFFLSIFVLLLFSLNTIARGNSYGHVHVLFLFPRSAVWKIDRKYIYVGKLMNKTMHSFVCMRVAFRIYLSIKRLIKHIFFSLRLFIVCGEVGVVLRTRSKTN